MSLDPSPLTGPPPKEVPLSEPPLERVIAQVRFPEVISIRKRDFVGPFQEAVRSRYPVLRPQERRRMVLEGGVLEEQSSLSWGFRDPKSGWWVTLAPEFLSLETTRYTSRVDFVERFREALEALFLHVGPAVIDRVGVRYVDRVRLLEPEELTGLVRAEVSGVLATPLNRMIEHAVSETVFRLPDEPVSIRAKWGWIPPRTSVDPTVLEPIDQSSWILDLDVFQTFPGDDKALDVEEVAELVRRFAERSYSMFRWAVTDDFLRRHGGEVE